MTRVWANIDASTLAAAKDGGDLKGDKTRKAAVQTLIQQAQRLKEEAPEGFNEVVEAAKMVDSLGEVLDSLDTTSEKLKAAPNDSDEASEAQRILNGIRRNLDSMIGLLQASFSSMETLVHAALEIQEQFKVHDEQAKRLDAELKQAKSRIDAIAAAVKSAAKIG